MLTIVPGMKLDVMIGLILEDQADAILYHWNLFSAVEACFVFAGIET